MPTQTPNEITQLLRNAVGSKVYVLRGKTAYYKTRVSPTNSTTPRRTRARLTLESTADAWASALSELSRENWRRAAQANEAATGRKPLGPLSGWQLFHRVNLALQNIGQPILEDPPANYPPDPVTDFSVNTLDATTQTITLNVSGATGPNTHLLIYATTNLPTTWQPAKKWNRLIKHVTPGWSSPIDITTDWTGNFGTLEGGFRVGFAVATVDDRSGQLSHRLYTAANTTGTSVPTIYAFKSGWNVTANGSLPTANAINLSTFNLPGNLSSTTIGFRDGVNTGTQNWGLGIYDMSGNLLAHTAPFTCTAAGFRTLTWAEGTVSLPAGSYLFAITADGTAAAIGLTNTSTIPEPLSTNTPTQTSTAGLLPSLITVPALGITNKTSSAYAYFLA